VQSAPASFDRLYRAFRRRDARLDGRVWVGVDTTGIYCLPSCGARKPLRRNVRFFASRAAAEQGGFRPCRVCRPELEGGRRALERAALDKWLAALAEADQPIRELARENGISDSRLYRLFRRHLGTGPRPARAGERLRRAQELLREGRLSVTEVAYESGFGSLNAFYRWFRRATGAAPGRYRAAFAKKTKFETRNPAAGVRRAAAPAKI
jgi:methylphosphotriester-DNA--protein-cysteine methyltransferase